MDIHIKFNKTETAISSSNAQYQRIILIKLETEYSPNPTPRVKELEQRVGRGKPGNLTEEAEEHDNFEKPMANHPNHDTSSTPTNTAQPNTTLALPTTSSRNDNPTLHTSLPNEPQIRVYHRRPRAGLPSNAPLPSSDEHTLFLLSCSLPFISHNIVDEDDLKVILVNISVSS
ncbi:BON association protein 2 [Striga asiatica]|uniref:BON association protein 2 n=1 Tax=Striga asiatica TaxID=4170 RepID=A0A5A7P0I8_STRAF|nr:BON association protein 2 [Striga asiatica]